MIRNVWNNAKIITCLEWEDGWNKTTSISCFTDSPNMLAEYEEFTHCKLSCDLPSPSNSDKRGQEDPFWSLFWPGMFNIHEWFAHSFCCQAGIMNLKLILGKYHIVWYMVSCCDQHQQQHHVSSHHAMLSPRFAAMDELRSLHGDAQRREEPGFCRPCWWDQTCDVWKVRRMVKNKKDWEGEEGDTFFEGVSLTKRSDLQL